MYSIIWKCIVLFVGMTEVLLAELNFLITFTSCFRGRGQAKSVDKEEKGLHS